MNFKIPEIPEIEWEKYLLNWKLWAVLIGLLILMFMMVFYKVGV